MHVRHGLVKFARETNGQGMLAYAIGLGFTIRQMLQGLQLLGGQSTRQLSGHFALHHPAGIKDTAGIF